MHEKSQHSVQIVSSKRIKQTGTYIKWETLKASLKAFITWKYFDTSRAMNATF